ncbi:MAG: ISKra4 family transposase [Chloroflexi bacterium]|nr:ISKra4 family transposase [Chloroflexota bacterium]
MDSWDLEGIELAARRQAMRVAARAVEERLNADTSDYAGSTAPCACGELARYAGRRSKSFESVLGLLTLQRAYYHCGACGTGFYPRDRTLGLEGGMLSPGVLRMLGMVGAMVSFEEGHELLRELAGVDVSTKHVERAAEALGREVAQDERCVVEPPAGSVGVASTLYLGLDGTGVPMRSSELEGREGKQPDGSSKTREVKLVTVWSAEGRDEEGTPVRDVGSVSYSAAIESAATRDTDKTPSEFAQRVEREAQRRGFDRAQRRVVLGDGAPWVWNLANEHFPGAIQIVDRFHAKQKLSEVAKSIYGPESSLGKEWVRQRYHELDAGDIGAVLDDLRAHAPKDDEARKCIDYIQRNRERMRYAKFRAEGLCTSTGVVEAGCKVAIGTRCKRAGMHWTVAGADAIIALRCYKLSDRFEDFWGRRSADRMAAS